MATAMRAQLIRLMQPAFTTALTVVLAGCLAGGGEQFRAGHAAYASGNLDEAYQQYSAAASADPSNSEYQAAKSKVAAEIAQKSAEEAQELEKAGRWGDAAGAWGRAAELDPKTDEFAVRQQLSTERTKDLDDKQWYEAAKAIADRYPGNESAEQALSGARERAFEYHVGLGEDLVAAGRGQEALRNFETAKKIDPDAPGLRVDLVTKAEALALAEDGDTLAVKGEHIAAYEKYQAAYAKLSLPEIKAKRDASKKKAGRILALLEQARSQSKRGRLGQAVALYEKAMKLGGVPDSVKEEADQARTSLVKQDAERAIRYAEKNRLRNAERTIQLGLRHAGVDKVVADLVKVGLQTAKRGQPAKAVQTIERSGLPESSPLFDAAQVYAVANAKKILGRAKRYAKRNKPKALALLGDIEMFEDDLPQIGELRRSLRAGSFLALLDEAKRSAKRKKDGEAASLLMAALNAAPNPDPLRGSIKTGTDALKVGRFAQAEKAFGEALTAQPRSKLAQAAVEVTRLRREQAEKEAVALLTTGKGNDLEATEVLEAGLTVDPTSKTAKAGAAALVARLKSKRLTDAQAGALIGFANRLGAVPEVAQAKVAEGADQLAKGNLPAAATAFSAAVDAAPGAELPKLGLKMAEARGLASLKGEARAATTGDEGAAEALAELLKKNPKDPDGRKQLQALVDKAKALAAGQNDAEAARFLGLVSIATNPGGDVKAALDDGHAALKVSNLGAAEKAYARAKSLDPNSIAAQTGYDIAKGARISALKGALSAVKTGADVKPLETQLVATVAVDPASPEAKDAIESVLGEAQKQGEAGNVKRAAQLLDAANAVTRPAPLKAAVATANALLGGSKFTQADEAYAKALALGASPVADAGRKIAGRGSASNLSAAVRGLETGDDLARGAAAARSLLKADPNDADARRAVKAGLARAQKATADGDDAGAARNLRAVAVALGESTAMAKGIDLLARGKYPEAEEAFKAKPGSEVARTGAQIARSRKLFSLKAGLSGKGASAALAIRRLFRADPNNPEAKKAFDALLAKAAAAAKAGDDVAAAEILNQASIAAGSPRPLERAIKDATAQLKDSRYALAELGFKSAREISADSKVVAAGLAISGSSRARLETETVKKLSGTGDPRPLAAALAASLRVDPKSPAVQQGLKVLLSRAAQSAKKGKDTDVAQAIEAAAVLENRSAGQIQAISEGAAQLGQGSFAAARKTFALANAGLTGTAVSGVAQQGGELAKGRQLARLRQEYAAARSAKDILLQAGVVQKILEVDPNDRVAKSAKKKLVVSVQKERLSAARTQKAQGKLGVAHLYLVRSLALNENDKAARAELADVEEKLKKSMDLIVVVEQVQRDTGLGTRVCAGFDSVLRKELQDTISKEASLGAYVLSPAWTELYEKKDKRAPSVNGGLRLRLEKCRIDRSSGEVAFEWDILTPRRGGLVAKGNVKVDLPRGYIPFEEQDREGKAASKKLADRVAKKLIEKLEESRSEIDAWLVSRAEYGMKNGDPVMVAEAYARLRQKNPRTLDPERIIPIEQYLAKNFR